MKKLFISLSIAGGMLAFLSINNASAQWTETATAVYLTNGTKPVGIGTTSPGYPLDIKQAGNCNFRVQSITSGSSNLILARSAATGVNCFVNYKTGTTALWYTGVAGNNTDFRIRNGVGVDNFFISQTTGYVGIGNTTPTEILDVLGNINASGTVKGSQLRIGTATGATGFIACIGGKLIATEVRVDLQAAWPDYVFSNDYKLMSLEELETSININKHLPGVPSASQMKDSGIMLGEMQTKTMEKIEEITIYLIQLKKENEQLKNRIELLEKK